MDTLPNELLYLLLSYCEGTQLRFTCKRFYNVSNAIYRERTQSLLRTPFDTQLWGQYQATFPFIEHTINWWLAYHFVRNRKLYFSPENTKIQPVNDVPVSPLPHLRPPNPTRTPPPTPMESHQFQQEQGAVILRSIQTFLFTETIKLPRGRYTVLLGLIGHRDARGLGTIKCTVQIGDSRSYTFYPPTFLNDMIPDDHHIHVRLGTFDSANEVEKVIVTVSEMGLYPKRNVHLTHVEVTSIPQVYKDEDFIYWSDPELDSMLERKNYMALQHIATTTTEEKEVDENWYTQGSRNVKMVDIVRQRHLREFPGPISRWRVRF